MRFGFDIDDTLINLRQHAFHIYNRKFDKNLGPDIFEKIDRVEIHEPFGLTDEEGQAMWNDLIEEILFTDCPPFPGAIETLNELEEAGHEIYYVTARFKENGEKTKKWLKDAGFPVKKENFFCGMKDEEKLHTIKDLKLDYYVDDKPAVLNTLRGHPVKLLVKDQTYNRNLTHIPRIVDWKQFKDLI